MRHNPTVIARLRPDRSGGTWGIFLPDEDRWLELLFDREREARHFAKDLMLAASKA